MNGHHHNIYRKWRFLLNLVDGQREGGVHGWTDGWRDRQMKGWTAGWTWCLASGLGWMGCLTYQGRDKWQHFQMHFLEWQYMNFDWNFTEYFFPKGPINNIPVLVQIRAWRQPGKKPLSEPMVHLLRHISITLPQWVKRYKCGIISGWEHFDNTQIPQKIIKVHGTDLKSNALKYLYTNKPKELMWHMGKTYFDD